MSARRFLLYFAWSRPRETGAPFGILDNRFPALFELRRAIWPQYEWAANPERYAQDISGFLDHVVLFDFQRFLAEVGEATGQPVRVVEREAAAGLVPLDGRLLESADTVIVLSLDHLVTEQVVSAAEIEALERFLRRPATWLVVCPHHDIGALGGQVESGVELAHHGDRLVPPRQRLGGFARSLLSALGFPVENRYGLSPARSPDGGPAPLVVDRALDTLGLLEDVETFNLHPHLPHLFVPPSLRARVRVLARQAIQTGGASHPFVESGHRHFDALLWMPPEGRRAGHLLVGDATLWSAAFGGLTSLVRFWHNLARMETRPGS